MLYSEKKKPLAGGSILSTDLFCDCVKSSIAAGGRGLAERELIGRKTTTARFFACGETAAAPVIRYFAGGSSYNSPPASSHGARMKKYK